MYQLTDEQKQWILEQTGKNLYSKAIELKKRDKISNETMKQMFAFWLNQHKIRHDEPYFKILTTTKDTSGYSKFIVKNESNPELYWEKYDESITPQTIKNEFQLIWNKR